MATAVFTKYLGPTSMRGSRIKAYAAVGDRRFVVLNYNPELSPEQNHDAAARALADQYAWNGYWYRGDAGDVYVYVRALAADEEPSFHIPYDAAKERARIDAIMTGE